MTTACAQPEHATTFAIVENEPERIFGRRMKEERERRGWKQADLADRLTKAGVPVIASAISKSEAGHRLVRLSEAVAIAAALGLPLSALLTDTSGREDRIAELRAEAARLSEESDDALRRAVYFRNEAALLAGEEQ